MFESIGPFIHRKVIVMPLDESAKNVAKAMCAHQAGSVVISDREGHIAGIVTDRDLACGLIASERDLDAAVAEFMTANLVTVAEDATLPDVIGLMQIHGVRRIPVVHQTKKGLQRCVGLVSLDDLLAAHAIEADDVAKIVKAQVVRRTRPLPFIGKKTESPAADQFTLLMKRIERDLARTREEALELANFVLGTLARRMNFSSAASLINELPPELQTGLLSLPAGPDRSVTGARLIDGVAARMGVGQEAAQDFLRTFWSTLLDFTSDRTMRHLLDQLPPDIRLALQGPPAERTSPYQEKRPST